MLKGRAAIKAMAETYPRLYLVPGEEGAEQAFVNAVRRGIVPERNSLSHYITDEKDCLETANTPVGPIDVLTLWHREDFETFLRCMTKRCTLAEIPKLQGAAIMEGIVNWNKIWAHKRRFFDEHKVFGDESPEWAEEFRIFTADKKNYTDTLIVISVGPYSNIPASSVGESEDEWISLSHTIRLYHECTHFIMRRNYPGMIDAVWDELLADAVGLYAAFGNYDGWIEKLFLGIEDGHYTGGRLIMYADHPQIKGEMERLSERVNDVVDELDRILKKESCKDPFRLIPGLQNRKHDLWDAYKSA